MVRDVAVRIINVIFFYSCEHHKLNSIHIHVVVVDTKVSANTSIARYH